MIIYLIENKTNGKKYVGQTRDLKSRLRAYKSASFNPDSKDYDRPIHRAIRKYGLENFSFEVVEGLPEGSSQELLDEKERYYIEKFFSLTSQEGYNVRTGGQKGAKNP